jgi:pentatricopeptide repeat protein
MRAAACILLTMVLTGCSTGAKAPVGRGFTLSWSPNERAIPKLEEKLKTDTDNPDLNAALGHAYLQKAREVGDPSYYSKSEPLFERALESNPDHVEALIGSASLAMSRHRFLEGLQTAQRAVKLNEYSAAARGVLADAYVQLGDYDNAVRVLDEMVRLKPNLSSYSRIANMRELKGDMEGAIKVMEMAIQAGAPDAENTAWCILQLGELYLKMSRINEAEIAFRSALRRFPEYGRAYAALARAAVARNDLDSAVNHYQKAIERVPEPEFLIALAAIYQKMGKGGEMEAQLERVSGIKEIYEANGVAMMDREIEELMSAAGAERMQARREAQAR